MALFEGGDHSIAELADLFGVTGSTVIGQWNGSGLASVRVWAQGSALADTWLLSCRHTWTKSVVTAEPFKTPLVVPSRHVTETDELSARTVTNPLPPHDLGRDYRMGNKPGRARAELVPTCVYRP